MLIQMSPNVQSEGETEDESGDETGVGSKGRQCEYVETLTWLLICHK